MAIERKPGYELCVGRSEEAEHGAMLSAATYAYRLGLGAAGAIEAFAILRNVGDAHGNLYLKRVAVARPEEGLGTAFLTLVINEAFGRMGAERLYLDCFADNARAQGAYQKLGFTRDGVLRKAIVCRTTRKD
jgi:ribosomal protein S18 acetylase RimI-like enzyme